MGGTSGALYSIFLNGLASALQTIASSSPSASLNSTSWSEALSSALTALYQYTRARPPSRTLVDPLDAFVRAFKGNPADFNAAAEQGMIAADATRKLKATAGRAAYVGEDELEHADVPDPGAWGVWMLLKGMGEVVG